MSGFSELTKLMGLPEEQVENYCGQVRREFKNEAMPPIALVIFLAEKHFRPGQTPTDLAAVVRESNEYMCFRVEQRFRSRKPSPAIIAEFVEKYRPMGKHPREIVALIHKSIHAEAKARKKAAYKAKREHRREERKATPASTKPKIRRSTSVWTISTPMGGQPPRPKRGPDPIDDL